MAQPYIGQIIAVGFNFAPLNWAFCNGQLLPISQFDALYNLLGTTYGGDGQTTFGVPDLRGRAPIHQGQGTGLSNYVLGQKAGVESVTLTGAQNASHNHTVGANSAVGNASNPSGTAVLAQAAGSADTIYSSAGPSATTLVSASVSNTGGSQPHENRQPLLAINYCIALYGLYPPQS
ncbi:MAG: phage tail protein [Alphaproteobacteria bacterium]